ncbi:glycosyltransferase [Aquimarina sp. 2201CG14-23]|uniref:glycosyltransferase n=1 Tax=Aquimarina mycalae TaxID=3040073 RepID=UPI002477CF7E|nr:glycosyltransferase family 2 protein [Aquimarina sp. 2201CG14-23]MDH7444854.1 glycosyltransferase family 2 protein [Aquimarina sp. 2201CG14-23]
MKIYVVIPAHNEEHLVHKTLASLVTQTVVPNKIVVVNDNSTDQTEATVRDYITNHPYISLVNINSSSDHIPGSKVINAFYQGYKTVDHNYDVICKFDADLIFPNNYIETIIKIFESDSNIGMASGILHIQKNNSWVYENIANKDHIRGPIKAYRKECFQAIGGLKKSIGWDTTDVLLSQYHNWKTVTDTNLIVKHLKPTGKAYHNSTKYLQGMAMYKMRYGITITIIAALKLALLKKQPRLIKDYLIGFFKAKRAQQPFLVSKSEGEFIRKLRWKKIKKKLL